MEKRYFAVKECAFNKQYFARFGFYVESDLTRGLGPRDTAQPTSKYMVQVVPRDKDRAPEIQALMDEAINALEGEIELLRNSGTAGRPARGSQARIEKLEGIVRDIKVA